MPTTIPGLTSGSYNFQPSTADSIVEAFDRVGIRAAGITRDHMISARRSVNNVLVEWSNRGVNLWAVDFQILPLQAPQNGVGVVDYFPPANTVQVLDVYYRYVNGGGPGIPVDRMMLPMSRTDWGDIPNKFQPGTPTRFWFERTIPPKLVIWQADVSVGNQLYYWRMRRLQDANAQTGEVPDIDYRFIDAFETALAVRFAEKYAPGRLQEKITFYKEAWSIAAGANRDDTPLSFRPNLSGYFRG